MAEPGPDEVTITPSGDGVIVVTPCYRWRWTISDDRAELHDADGALIFAHPLQPAVEAAGRPGEGGTHAEHRVAGDALEVTYASVSGGARLRIAVRFAATHITVERVVYEPAGDEPVVRLVLFGRWDVGAIVPALAATACLVPGGRQDPEQAIFSTAGAERLRFSVGCFGQDAGTFHQQWALPHYFICAWSADRGAPAACIGLGGVPDGNVMVELHDGHASYGLNVRGDLWHHRKGPAPVVFDDPLIIAPGSDWYRAARAYFDALVAEGLARPKTAADVPASAYLPQYDTWGDQGARRCFLERFDEGHLRAIFDDFRASGLRSELFVIDDKWEGIYGSLEHDTQRFPSFVPLLGEIRAAGCGIGIWTAFPRCEDYEALGLTVDAVLKRPDGTPHVVEQGNRHWYIFDPTHQPAAALLRERAAYLVRAYRPALVKIDFGYEIPRPDVAGPGDPAWGGERLFLKFLQVVVGAIKEADPDVAVLYYCLTPLFNHYLDQSGVDDLWMSRGAYAAGFARRALLTSLCGAFGVVPYGSSGYDWRSIAEIWLDTAVIGTPGVIAPLAGDEYGERLTPALAARYNGVARVARRTPRFDVAFYDADLVDPSAGPVARSWGRVEQGRTVLVALRPDASGRAVAPGVAEADAAVIVGSLSDAAIADAPAVGIVPFAPGSVRIERAAPGAVTARARLLGGATVPHPVTSRASAVEVALAPETPAGAPVEWIELAFADEANAP